MVYDWDSLSIAREPIIVGQAAHAFTMNWENSRRQRLPMLAEALGFLADYQVACGAAFCRAECRAARAALVYTMAYTARCEHSDATRGGITAVREGSASVPQGPRRHAAHRLSYRSSPGSIENKTESRRGPSGCRTCDRSTPSRRKPTFSATRCEA